MNALHFQKGILKWFRLDPNTERHTNALRAVCRNVCKTNAEETFTNYRYQIIYPLLKLGAIEQYNDVYKLSPSSALHKTSRILFCNIPVKSVPFTGTPLYDTSLGVEVYEYNSNNISKLHQLGITSSLFRLHSHLQKVSLEKTIESWPSVKVVDTRNYHRLDENNNWELAKEVKPGVYKMNKEVYARRLIMVSENNWRSISNNWNDLAIAVLWSKIQNNQRINIRYVSKRGTIILNNEYFPLVLERLILINTLLEGKYPDNYPSREYHLSINEFATFNRIFHNRISVI
jgi:hypothetical protein